VKNFKIIIYISAILFAVACNQNNNKKSGAKINDTIQALNRFKITNKKDVNAKTDNLIKYDNSFNKTIVKRTKNSIENIKIIENTGPKKKYSKDCENLITEIVTSSNRYKQITKGLNKAVVKNGGQFFGIRLDGSPDPKPKEVCGYSKTFDFIVYEMYPDRQLNTARFSFDPDKKLLYENNINSDKLKPLEFDKKLLIKYDSICACF
jgi:hypothetical protein